MARLTISSISRFVEGFQGQRFFVGIDVHKRSFSVAGPTGFGLARSLHSAGIKVIVAAPSRIPRPVAATNKTDSLDCIKLAELAASGLVQSIAIPNEKEEAFRALSRRRHQLTDSIRRVKQRIRSLLLQNRRV